MDMERQGRGVLLHTPGVEQDGQVEAIDPREGRDVGGKFFLAGEAHGIRAAEQGDTAAYIRLIRAVLPFSEAAELGGKRQDKLPGHRGGVGDEALKF